MTTRIRVLLALCLALAGSFTQMIDGASAKKPLQKLISESKVDKVDDEVNFTDLKCETNPETGKPATFAHFYNASGAKRRAELITWSPKYIKDANWSPTRRCNAVTARLVNHLEKDTENNRFSLRLKSGTFLIASTMEYINSTTGGNETAQVICFANAPQGQNDSQGCNSIFLTLANNENPSEVIASFNNFMSQAASDFPSALSRGSDGVDLGLVMHGFKKGIRNGSVVTYPVP